MTHRPDARCSICGSLERHRLAFLLLRDCIPPGQTVLHVAPEATMLPWLVSLSREYLSIDLHSPAMRRMDLTNLELSDGTQTLIWCSHVLEHVPDDRKALAELFRVLAPGGLLMLQVPIRGSVTREDPTVQTDTARLEQFLQEDHIRLYGLDLKDRIEDSGFVCEVLSSEALPVEDQRRYSVRTPLFRQVFLCRRPT